VLFRSPAGVPLGFDVKIQRLAGPVAIQDNALGVIATLAEVGQALGARLMDNSGAGTWLIYSVGEDTAVPELYIKNFTATSDWTDDTTHWSVSVPATEHGLGTQPLVKIYENSLTPGPDVPAIEGMSAVSPTFLGPNIGQVTVVMLTETAGVAAFVEPSTGRVGVAKLQISGGVPSENGGRSYAGMPGANGTNPRLTRLTDTSAAIYCELNGLGFVAVVDIAGGGAAFHSGETTSALGADIVGVSSSRFLIMNSATARMYDVMGGTMPMGAWSSSTSFGSAHFPVSASRINDTTFGVTFTTLDGGNYKTVLGVLGTTAGGDAFASAASYPFPEAAGSGSRISRLTDTSAIVSFLHTTSLHVAARVITFAGTTPTLGDLAVLVSQSTESVRISRITDTTAVVLHAPNSGDPRPLSALALRIDGATVYGGETYQFAGIAPSYTILHGDISRISGSSLIGIQRGDSDEGRLSVLTTPIGSEPGPSTSELIPAGGDLTLDASGNIAARAENAPDMRFAGRIVVRV
jgi:hypothetical protein